MGAIYRIYNGVSIAAVVVPVATGTPIQTMLQVKSVAGVWAKIKAWGVSMDAAAAAAGVQWELIETGVVAATVTAHAASGLHARNRAAMQSAATVFFSLGTEATGFTGSAEGTVTESRLFDHQLIQPTGQYAWEWSLDSEPEVDPEHLLRIRVKAAADVNAVCWVDLEV